MEFVCKLAIILAILLFFPLTCRADNAITQLDEVSINYRNYTAGGRDPLVTQNGMSDRELGDGFAITANTTIFHYFYWNNMVHGTTDRISSTGGAGQYRAIGWKFELGVRLIDNCLDLEYAHHSQHILDYEGPNDFPVENSLGLRLYLYKTKEHRQGIF